jgi:TPR repeat protein
MTFELLITQAMAGDSEAQYRLASTFADKNSPQYRMDQAVRWLTAAADQGHLEACVVLGELLEWGDGVAQDHEEAARLY